MIVSAIGLMMLIVSDSGNEKLLQISQHKTMNSCLMAKKDYAKLQSANVTTYCVDMDNVTKRI